MIQTGQWRAAGRRITGGRTLITLTAMVAIAGAVNAVEDVSLNIDHVDGDGWSAQGVVVSLGLPRGKVLAHATIARLRIQSLSQELRDLRIECPKLGLSATTISCDEARLTANLPGLGAQSLGASIKYGRNDGSLDVALDGIQLAQGQASLRGSLHDQGWRAAIEMRGAPLERLVELAQALRAPIPPLSASGSVTLSAHGRGSGGDLQEGHIDATFIDVTANNDSGSLASDKLSLQLQAEAHGTARDLRFSLQLRSGQGQAYVQPIFLDLGAHSISLQAAGSLRDGNDLSITHFEMKHAEGAQAAGQLHVKLDHPQPLRSLRLDLQRLQFPGAYTSYFQPLLLDTSFKAMQTSGEIGGQLLIEQGAARSVDVEFRDVSLDDGARNFVLAGLQGQWHWRAGSDSEARAVGGAPRVGESSLHWRDGAIFGMDLGETAIRFLTQGRAFRLLQPAHIPLLDGSLELQSFRIRNAGTPDVAFTVDATIQPVSMPQLCKAFGWPEFGGRVGGAISNLRMREGVLTLGTTLRAQVFDGEVTIEDLRLEQPLGQWPRLFASIGLDNLDLEQVTSAFSFGRITGRLSGAIEGLRLFNWTPVAFDARLYTPSDDRSRHRISQRAVENIGSLGGGGAGVSAALSSGLLRFFDDFNYDRLGLSCRLENDVCIMNGIAPAPDGGYYLVKGKWLPRIDVIGSTRRVDWPRLVQQLVALTRSEGPVVE